MGEVNIWFGLSTFLGGSLLTGVAAYFAVMRNQLTKESHAAICTDKQQIVSIQLKAINEKLSEHGSMLKRLLLNGKGGS